MAIDRKRLVTRKTKTHSMADTSVATKKNSVPTREFRKSKHPGKAAEPSKSLNSEQDTLRDVESRLFSIPKKSRLLFVSSSMPQKDNPAVVSSVVGKADKTRNFYIIEQSRDGISTTKCLEQGILSSHDAGEPFVTAMETVEKKDVAAQNEYPCLLLVCGENNVFNKGNRGSANRIEPSSLSDRMIIALKRIQNRKWCIVNPSHKPHKGIIGNWVMAFHKACSQDQRIKCDFTINNPARQAGNPPFQANTPTCWQSGKPISGQIVCSENGLYMHRFDL